MSQFTYSAFSIILTELFYTQDVHQNKVTLIKIKVTLLKGFK